MIYPVGTLIKYLFGSRDAATNLLSNITPKRIIGFHFVNLILSSLFALGTSKLIVDLIKLDGSQEVLSQYLTISNFTMFNSYLPVLFGTYIFSIIFLIIIASIYQLVAKLFKSTATFKTTIYATQFYTILHPLFHLSIFLMMAMNTLGLAAVILIPSAIFAIILFFTTSKQSAQILNLTTITMIILNVILMVILVLLFLSLIGGVPTTL